MPVNKEKNQPPFTLNTLRPADHKAQEICKNYVWGICKKYTHCKFRHELVFDEMKKILKFCHDYQNKMSCDRQCTYLHATNEEEAHFLATGTMPRALAERHAAMAAGDPGKMTPGLVMKTAMFVPTPSQAITPDVKPISAATMKVQSPSVSAPRLSSFLSVPSTSKAPFRALSAPRSTLSPLLAFDPRVPPPSLAPTGGKRKFSDLDDGAGASKVAKKASLCEECVQRTRRTAANIKTIEEQTNMEADLKLLSKHILEKFNRKRSLLAAFVGPEKIARLDHYIANGRDAHDVAGHGTSAAALDPNIDNILMELTRQVGTLNIQNAESLPKMLLTKLMGLLTRDTAGSSSVASQGTSSTLDPNIDYILLELTRQVGTLNIQDAESLPKMLLTKLMGLMLRDSAGTSGLNSNGAGSNISVATSSQVCITGQQQNLIMMNTTNSIYQSSNPGPGSLNDPRAHSTPVFCPRVPPPAVPAVGRSNSGFRYTVPPPSSTMYSRLSSSSYVTQSPASTTSRSFH